MSLYAPDREYMTWVRFLCVSRFPLVFLVRRAILRSVPLKMLVMYEVSLPTYVKLAHFWGGCRVLWLGWFEGVRFVRFDGEGVVL